MEAGFVIAGVMWALVIISGIAAARASGQETSVWDTAAKRLGFQVTRRRRIATGSNSQPVEILRAVGFGREFVATVTASADTELEITLDGTFPHVSHERLAKVLDALGHPPLPPHMGTATRATVRHHRLHIEVFGQPWREGEISGLIEAVVSLARLLDDDAVAEQILQIAATHPGKHTRAAALDMVASSNLPRSRVVAVARGAVANASGRGLLIGATVCLQHARDVIDDDVRRRIYAALAVERNGDVLHERLIDLLVEDAAGRPPGIGAELVATLRTFAERVNHVMLPRTARMAAKRLRASLADGAAGQFAVFAPAGDAGALAVSEDERLLAHPTRDDEAEQVDEASAQREGR